VGTFIIVFIIAYIIFYHIYKSNNVDNKMSVAGIVVVIATIWSIQSIYWVLSGEKATLPTVGIIAIAISISGFINIFTRNSRQAEKSKIYWDKIKSKREAEKPEREMKQREKEKESLRQVKEKIVLEQKKKEVIQKMFDKHTELKYANDINVDQKFEPHMYALFDCIIDPESRRYLSEDYAFCRRWQQMGKSIKMNIHSTLGHIGTIPFKFNLKQRLRTLRSND